MKPDFSEYNGSFGYRGRGYESQYWVFEDGEWRIEMRRPHSAYYALHKKDGEALPAPFLLLNDVQAYQEWQKANGIKPDVDEWWSESSSDNDDD